MHKAQFSKTMGVWGHAPSGNFLDFNSLKDIRCSIHLGWSFATWNVFSLFKKYTYNVLWKIWPLSVKWWKLVWIHACCLRHVNVDLWQVKIELWWLSWQVKLASVVLWDCLNLSVSLVNDNFQTQTISKLKTARCSSDMIINILLFWKNE